MRSIARTLRLGKSPEIGAQRPLDPETLRVRLRRAASALTRATSQKHGKSSETNQFESPQFGLIFKSQITNGLFLSQITDALFMKSNRAMTHLDASWAVHSSDLESMAKTSHMRSVDDMSRYEIPHFKV
jgi:hypothetical protein